MDSYLLLVDQLEVRLLIRLVKWKFDKIGLNGSAACGDLS